RRRPGDSAVDQLTGDWVEQRGAAVWEDLLPALRRLDRVIERAVARARHVFGEPQANPFRGLTLGPDDLDRWLARPAGSTWLDREGGAAPAAEFAERGLALDRLGQSFGLSGFDLDLVLIALGPELDLKYEKLYAFLQDDVTRKRPSIDLALSLLC